MKNLISTILLLVSFSVSAQTVVPVDPTPSATYTYNPTASLNNITNAAITVASNATNTFLPRMLTNALFQAQADVLATNTIYTTPNAVGVYRITTYLVSSQAGVAGTAQPSIGWQDTAKVQTAAQGGAVALAVLGTFAQSQSIILSSNVTTISFGVGLTVGITGTKYDISYTLEQLK